MRSRAAILPFPGDPFLLHYWLKFFELWESEVDKLYIYFNSPVEPSVIDYIRELCLRYPKINLQYNPLQIEHGEAINRTLDIVKEEYIMLIEDDGFIFKKGLVDTSFEALESSTVDVIGSKRGSCSQEILDRCSELYGLRYEGMGDQGCNFWPNFFFCRKELLLRTNRHFGARAWQKGELIEPLSRPNDPYYAKDMVTSDTFVEASLQILAMVPQERIRYLPQYHGSPDDLEHYERQYNLFDGVAPWCHVGSLSSGMGGILQDGRGRSLARRLIEPEKSDGTLPDYCHTEQEKSEWERRVQWWLTFLENREEGKIDGFALMYQDAISRLIDQYKLNRNRIQRRQNIYRSIGL